MKTTAAPNISRRRFVPTFLLNKIDREFRSPATSFECCLNPS
jgi:hypothetical protein